MRMVILIMALLTTSVNAYCQDIKSNNPQRKLILDSVRFSARYSYLSETKSKFVVKKIWASDKWAYLCALVIEKDGGYQATDGQLDLYEIVLSKRGGKWIPVTDINGFAKSPKEVICSLTTNKNISDVILKRIFEENKAKGFIYDECSGDTLLNSVEISKVPRTPNMKNEELTPSSFINPLKENPGALPGLLVGLSR